MATQEQIDEHIRSYYDLGGEQQRLTTRSVAGALELERVRHLVQGRLEPRSAILDVGGATGVHAAWLADLGHRVTLLDPVASQVEVASHIGTFEAHVGDARDLDAGDASVDAVLLFGPLYHLAERDERLRALGEAARVLKPGGLVFAQGISRLAAFSDRVHHRDGFEGLGAEDLEVLQTGRWAGDGVGFPAGHFHSAPELSAELSAAGFDDIELYGVEGPHANALEPVPESEELLAQAFRLVETLEETLVTQGLSPAILAHYSPHILAIGRAPHA